MKMTVNPAVTETKVVEISPATYTLELSEKEIALLASLVGKVAGCRGRFSAVANKLWDDGLEKFSTSINYPKEFEATYSSAIKFVGD